MPLIYPVWFVRQPFDQCVCVCAWETNWRRIESRQVATSSSSSSQSCHPHLPSSCRAFYLAHIIVDLSLFESARGGGGEAGNWRWSFTLHVSCDILPIGVGVCACVLIFICCACRNLTIAEIETFAAGAL